MYYRLGVVITMENSEKVRLMTAVRIVFDCGRKICI